MNFPKGVYPIKQLKKNYATDVAFVAFDDDEDEEDGNDDDDFQL